MSAPRSHENKIDISRIDFKETDPEIAKYITEAIQTESMKRKLLSKQTNFKHTQC